MREYTVPSRKGLIIGLALTALHGRQQGALAEARHFNHDDPRKCPVYLECVRVANEIREGKACETRDSRLVTLMAHTQQLARVSHDEWEDAVKVTLVSR